MFRHWRYSQVSQHVLRVGQLGSPCLCAPVSRRAFCATGRRLKSPESQPEESSRAVEDAQDESEVRKQPQTGVVWKTLSQALSSESNSARDEQSTDKTTDDKSDAKPSKPKATRRRSGTAKSKASKAKKSDAAGEDLHVHKIVPSKLELKHIPTEDKTLPPRLAHRLDRILFNPGGAYHMQDPRSRVYNFDPYLATIMPVSEFDYDALKEYITSSKDTKLRDLAAKHDKKFCGSTSSLTGLLSHFHYLFSAWRLPRFDNMSRLLEIETKNFTQLLRAPAAAFAHFDKGVYAIDADKEHDSSNILSTLGKSLEKLLTLPKEDFEKYRRTKSHELTEEERNAEEPYYYSTLGDFMMRSQLDAYDPRLPGTGVFDLKTRAVVSIRMDVQDYEKGVGYEIRERYGQWDSFEREYYDLIRAAFLKYSLQVRMGSMDGIFVAFHDTHRIFGFQYISLQEMDYAIHGTTDTRLGDQEFKASVKLLNELLNKATERFPGKTLRIHVETRPTKVPLTYFFAEPVSDEEMANIQDASKRAAEDVVKDIQTIAEQEESGPLVDAEETQSEDAANGQETAETDAEESDFSEVDLLQDIQSESAWRDMMAKVDETVESESLGIKSVREAVQDALEKSGLFEGKSEADIERYSDMLATSLAKYSLESRDLRQEAEESDADKAEEERVAEERPEAEQSLAGLILKVTESMSDKQANLDSLQRIFTGLPSSAETTSEKAEEAVEDEAGEAEAADKQDGREILGMYVTIRNKVNGKFVERPEGGENFKWNIEYTVTELNDESARKIHGQIIRRRRTVLKENPHKSKEWYRMFRGQLPTRTREGRKFRDARRKEENKRTVNVSWLDGPWSLGNPKTSQAKNGEDKK